MIIKEIRIKNFRSYYGECSFKISDGLTLIIGGNGDGKTTFFEALEWLFNTATENKNESHISEKRKSELEIGESDEVLVSVSFEHDGLKELCKSFSFERVNKDYVRTHNFKFIGYEQEKSERCQILGNILLERCFDTVIRKYCLFKGESELNVFDNSTALKTLVDTFSGIKQFDTLVEYSTKFEEKSDKAFKQESKNDDKIAHKAKELDSQLTIVSNKIQDLKKDIKQKELSINDYQSKLSNLEKDRETSERCQEIKNRLNALKDKKAKIAGHLRIDYNAELLDNYWILQAFTPILEEFQKKAAALSKQKRQLEKEETERRAEARGAQKAVDDIRKVAGNFTELPWNLPDKGTMQEMIDEEVCKVCGRKAPKGSEAYEFMVHKLEEYLRHMQQEAEAKQKELESEKPLFQNSYIEEIHTRMIQLSGQEEKWISNIRSEISDTLAFISSRRAELEEIEKEIQETEDERSRLLIQSPNLTEELLDKNFSDLKGYMETISRDERRLDELKRDLDDQLRIKSELDAEYAALQPQNSNAKVYQRVHSVLKMIMEAFVQTQKRNVTEFLQLLEEEANKYFRKLNKDDFSGIVKIIPTADDSAKIELRSLNGSLILDPGGAQRTTMYMSVLFAISNITTLKREQDYPLIFDAPTSSFEDAKEDVFYNVIDKIDKQCIIVTKDLLLTDENSGEKRLNETKINQLTCSVYRINKARGFNPLDLSTIQTIITPIK
ncbi:MAG: AAA family ATPase [Bacteroidales bacterium]|nr:AAA family ATPase [Bacteroidales bacterium]